MSQILVPSSGWGPRRWIGSILAIFLFQVGLIFWLSERPHSLRPKPVTGWAWRVAGPGWAEILELQDPALFLLPHPHNFSGLAWMNTPGVPASSFFWSEEPKWLTLRDRELGSTFGLFLATNDFRPPSKFTLSEPALVLPEIAKQPGLPSSSTLRIEGPLSRRTLVTAPALRAWEHTDLLTNSVVQILIDAEGRPVSPGTLLVSSGYPLADQFALEQVRMVRFNSLGENIPVTLQNDTWGTLVFEWTTLALPGTNSPGNAPHP